MRSLIPSRYNSPWHPSAAYAASCLPWACVEGGSRSALPQTNETRRSSCSSEPDRVAVDELAVRAGVAAAISSGFGDEARRARNSS